MEKEQTSAWTQAESFPVLAEDEVQVWRVATGVAGGERGEANVAASRALLQTSELERAERMRAGLPRDEFVLGRGCLRALLGRILEKPPLEIGLEAGPYGKPRVAGVVCGVQFNVSHSHGVVLIALCRSAAVGVDIERVEPGIEAMEIAEKHFAPGERAAVESAPDTLRTLAFCRIWARKEAVVKAHGQGLTLGLTEFDVSGDAGDTLDLPMGIKTESYVVQDLPVDDGFVAALAIAQIARPVRLLQLTNNLVENLLRGGSGSSTGVSRT